ncbi:hypothetical protein O9992_02290 [Vibrio lentus]|nr:hypothetical protein [Vibrio lentus]
MESDGALKLLRHAHWYTAYREPFITPCTRLRGSESRRTYLLNLWRIRHSTCWTWMPKALITSDRKLLLAISGEVWCGPVGIDSLAAAIGEEKIRLKMYWNRI